MGSESQDDDPGKQFLNWVVENIKNGRLPVDAPNARIYTVPEGIFLVSLAIFKEFIENTVSQSSWKQVQKRFLKLNVHTKTADGLNVHRHEVKVVFLFGVVVPYIY